MAIEQFVNNATTTLDGGIDDTVTSLDVDSFADFPADEQYRIMIDSEIMLVTGGAGTTTWTVTRGVESTTAASHADDSPVTFVMTAASILKGIGDISQAGAYASRPAAGREGQIYLPNEDGLIHRDNGSTFDTYGFYPKFKQPPLAASWTWVNQGTAAVTDQGGTVRMDSPAQNSEDCHILKIAAPSAPFTVTAAFRHLLSGVGSSFRNWGLCLREASSGKLKTISLNATTNAMMKSCYRFNSPTSFNSSPFARIDMGSFPEVWFLRIEDNNTNCLYSISSDGIAWSQILSETRTSFFTHDEIGWYVNLNTSVPSSMLAKSVWLLSWEVT